MSRIACPRCTSLDPSDGAAVHSTTAGDAPAAVSLPNAAMTRAIDTRAARVGTTPSHPPRPVATPAPAPPFASIRLPMLNAAADARGSPLRPPRDEPQHQDPSVSNIHECIAGVAVGQHTGSKGGERCPSARVESAASRSWRDSVALLPARTSARLDTPPARHDAEAERHDGHRRHDERAEREGRVARFGVHAEEVLAEALARVLDGRLVARHHTELAVGHERAVAELRARRPAVARIACASTINSGHLPFATAALAMALTQRVTRARDGSASGWARDIGNQDVANDGGRAASFGVGATCHQHLRRLRSAANVQRGCPQRHFIGLNRVLASHDAVHPQSGLGRGHRPHDVEGSAAGSQPSRNRILQADSAYAKLRTQRHVSAQVAVRWAPNQSGRQRPPGVVGRLFARDLSELEQRPALGRIVLADLEKLDGGLQGK
mmetsp:Transcript_10249/g.35816  ORF Transcript_10249/g.35816 Transcript_10249/m.35816 type:complete len:437 (-) Transcript_10249:2106-3416(-)